jgi:hypothetical protein
MQAMTTACMSVFQTEADTGEVNGKARACKHVRWAMALRELGWKQAFPYHRLKAPADLAGAAMTQTRRGLLSIGKAEGAARGAIR